MNKEEFDINQELDQMRQDYAAMKAQLDKQQIVSDHLIENSIKSDVRRLFLSKKSIPYAIVLNIVLVVLSYVQGFAWWVSLALIIFGVIFIPGAFWVYKDVQEDTIYNGDILTTTGALRKFKKRYVVLTAAVYLYFFAFAVFATVFMTSMDISAGMMWRRGLLIAILCVAVLAMEYYSAKRLLSSCDAIIERLQMKEVTPENN